MWTGNVQSILNHIIHLIQPHLFMLWQGFNWVFPPPVAGKSIFVNAKERRELRIKLVTNLKVNLFGKRTWSGTSNYLLPYFCVLSVVSPLMVWLWESQEDHSWLIYLHCAKVGNAKIYANNGQAAVWPWTQEGAVHGHFLNKVNSK